MAKRRTTEDSNGLALLYVYCWHTIWTRATHPRPSRHANNDSPYPCVQPVYVSLCFREIHDTSRACFPPLHHQHHHHYPPLPPPPPPPPPPPHLLYSTLLLYTSAVDVFENGERQTFTFRIKGKGRAPSITPHSGGAPSDG